MRSRAGNVLSTGDIGIGGAATGGLVVPAWLSDYFQSKKNEWSPEGDDAALEDFIKERESSPTIMTEEEFQRWLDSTNDGLIEGEFPPELEDRSTDIPPKIRKFKKKKGAPKRPPQEPDNKYEEMLKNTKSGHVDKQFNKDLSQLSKKFDKTIPRQGRAGQLPKRGADKAVEGKPENIIDKLLESDSKISESLRHKLEAEAGRPSPYLPTSYNRPPPPIPPKSAPTPREPIPSNKLPTLYNEPAPMIPPKVVKTPRGANVNKPTAREQLGPDKRVLGTKDFPLVKYDPNVIARILEKKIAAKTINPTAAQRLLEFIKKNPKKSVMGAGALGAAGYTAYDSANENALIDAQDSWETQMMDVFTTSGNEAAIEWTNKNPRPE